MKIFPQIDRFSFKRSPSKIIFLMNFGRGRAPQPKTTVRRNIPNNAPSFSKTNSSSIRNSGNQIFSMSNRIPTTSTKRATNTAVSGKNAGSNAPLRGAAANRQAAAAKKYDNVSTHSAKAQPSQPPEKELMKAITAILTHTSSSISFASVYRAARNITTNSLSLELFDKLKIELSNRLDDIDIDSIQKLLNEWKNFQKEITQIQSFMKFAGLKSIQDQYDLLPHWKYKELYNQHTNKCIKMGIEAWNSEVHPRALYILHDEIQNAIKKLITNDKNCDQQTLDLFDLLRLLGHNLIEPITELFRNEYQSLSPNTSDSDRLMFLINETKKLSNVFPVNVLQPITIVPYMSTLVNNLLEKRIPEPLIALKQFLLPEYITKYTQLVVDQMKKVSLPIDYFSLVGYLNFYSSVMYNDAPARAIVSTFISKADSKFDVQFVSVLFGHFDQFPKNVKELAPLIPLYANSEKLTTELTRAFLLKLMQRHAQDKDKEYQFAKVLSTMFSTEQMQHVFGMLRDYTPYQNLIIMNTTLSMPLISNDQTKVPPEFEGAILKEIKSFSEKFQCRKYHISGAFTIFYVKAKWGQEERFITMSALQYLLIQMVMKKDFNFKSTNSTIDTLNNALKFLIKSQILKKSGNQFYVSDTPPKEKKLNIYLNSINIRNVERQKIKQSHDHSMSIQSVIARLIKASRKMDETTLISKVTQELSPLFNVRDGDVPNVIKHMIESDFLERDKSNPKVLLYVP